MYDDHLRFIGKRVVDFLLVLIEPFSSLVRAGIPRSTEKDYSSYQC